MSADKFAELSVTEKRKKVHMCYNKRFDTFAYFQNTSSSSNQLKKSERNEREGEKIHLHTI